MQVFIAAEGIRGAAFLSADYLRCRLLPPSHDRPPGSEAGKPAPRQVSQRQDRRLWYELFCPETDIARVQLYLYPKRIDRSFQRFISVQYIATVSWLKMFIFLSQDKVLCDLHQILFD